MKKTVAVLFLSLLGAAAARADDANPDRPGIADSSSVVGAGRFQVESGIQQEWRRDGPSRDRLRYVPTLLRVGVGDQWEARVEGNMFGWERHSDPVDGVQHSAGAMPVSLGVKYNWQAADDSGRPSLGVIARVFPRSGSETFGTHRATGDVRLVADVELNKQWAFNPNLGVASYEDEQGRQFSTALLAATLSYAANKRVNLFVDTGMQSREERHGHAEVLADTGVAWMLTEDVQLDASIGKGVHGSTVPHRFASAGVSIRF